MGRTKMKKRPKTRLWKLKGDELKQRENDKEIKTKKLAILSGIACQLYWEQQRRSFEKGNGLLSI